MKLPLIDLLFSTADLEHYGQLLIMAPPVRSKNHVEALWKGLEAGWIDALGSDHAPHALSEKSADMIWDVKVGVPGLVNHVAPYFDAC